MLLKSIIWITIQNSGSWSTFTQNALFTVINLVYKNLNSIFNLLMVYQLSSAPLPLPSVPLPLLSFLKVLNLRHSVHWGYHPSPLKNITPFFLTKPPLNRQTVQAPFLGNPPPLHWFFVTAHRPPPPPARKFASFSEPPKYCIKFFILNTILSFKSN